MAKRFRCPRPINRLVMGRAKNFYGPRMQAVSRSTCIKGQGNYFAPGGPGAISYENLNSNWRLFSVWQDFGASVAQDQVGIDGQPNAASTISDDNVSGIESRRCELGIPVDVKPVSMILYVKATTGATTFPAIRFQLRGGATQTAEEIILNTNDGSYHVSSGQGRAFVDPYNGFWKVVLWFENNGGNTSGRSQIYPAASSTGTTTDPAVTGSAVFDAHHVLHDCTGEKARTVPPVPTDGAGCGL